LTLRHLFLIHFTDVAVITTPDSLHTDIAIALSKRGYHILVEKPMAIKAEDCGLITKSVHENNVILAVGHVMR
jgi:predicted dehydrogenase